MSQKVTKATDYTVVEQQNVSAYLKDGWLLYGEPILLDLSHGGVNSKVYQTLIRQDKPKRK